MTTTHHEYDTGTGSVRESSTKFSVIAIPISRNKVPKATATMPLELQSVNIITTRRGPKPKCVAERKVAIPSQIQRPCRSYSRAKKLQVLNFLQGQVPTEVESHTGFLIKPSSRAPLQDEAAALFQIPQTTISGWLRSSEKILHSSKGERCIKNSVPGRWPEMEAVLHERFLEDREAGRAVRRGWFRRTATQLFQSLYGPEGEFHSSARTEGRGVFGFSNRWFRNFLQRYKISLRLITRKAQKVPEEYRSLIIAWIRFN